MFSMNPGMPIVWLNVLIILLLAFVGYLTSNPLVIFGLFLLQSVPIADTNSMLIAAMGNAGAAQEEEIEHPHDSGDHKIGYLAQIREKAAA